jgi:hypothetical protein
MYSGLQYVFKGDKINGGLVEVPTTMLSQYDRRTRGAHKFSQINIFISFLSSLIQYQSGTVYLIHLDFSSSSSSSSKYRTRIKGLSV